MAGVLPQAESAQSLSPGEIALNELTPSRAGSLPQGLAAKQKINNTAKPVGVSLLAIAFYL
jgi:hypothetical protein